MPKSARPTSYVLPSEITPEPPPVSGRPNPRPGDGRIPDEWPVKPTGTMSQAVRMMASGLGPMQQAKLFRR